MCRRASPTQSCSRPERQQQASLHHAVFGFEAKFQKQRQAPASQPTKKVACSIFSLIASKAIGVRAVALSLAQRQHRLPTTRVTVRWALQFNYCAAQVGFTTEGPLNYRVGSPAAGSHWVALTLGEKKAVWNPAFDDGPAFDHSFGHARLGSRAEV